jgi:hypothetical protein
MPPHVENPTPLLLRKLVQKVISSYNALRGELAQICEKYGYFTPECIVTTDNFLNEFPEE